jgi:flagellar biosynthesis GTPase FlhF
MLLSPQIRKPVAVSTSRAVRALRKAQSEGLLVIDTPPLSPGDRSAIRKLASLLGELEPERVTIVLPATLGATATAQLLQALRPLGANSLALTHTEETDQIGVAVEAACKSGLAPEYMLERARAGGWSIGGIDPTGLATRLVQ